MSRLLEGVPEDAQELRDKADELFREVIKDHPGTPYAARAQIELGRGYGVELFEDYDDLRNLGRSIKLPKF